MYINKNFSTGFRIAAGFIVRNLFKNKNKLINTVINDMNYTNSLKNFLESDNQ